MAWAWKSMAKKSNAVRTSALVIAIGFEAVIWSSGLEPNQPSQLRCHLLRLHDDRVLKWENWIEHIKSLSALIWIGVMPTGSMCIGSGQIFTNRELILVIKLRDEPRPCRRGQDEIEYGFKWQTKTDKQRINSKRLWKCNGCSVLQYPSFTDDGSYNHHQSF